jgi:hypothetical protein
MCFVLFIGTSKPLPRNKFDPKSTEVAVKSVSTQDKAIKTHFTLPEVQYVGSTSGCGCDFPFASFQNGGWPEIDFYNQRKHEEKDEASLEREETARQNRDALIRLLRSSGEKLIELYGIWNGDCAATPQAQEDISLQTLESAGFYLKERGFYRLHL